MSTRILIVEDEPLVGEALRLHLEHLGYEVQGIAPSGEAALAAVASQCPDVLLMDIILQGRMDGIETAQLIRERFDIPILYLTAHPDEHLFQRAKITEPFAYLLKPFNERELHLTIEMALSRQQTEKRLRDARDHLEMHVVERTQELVQANAMLLYEIQERQRVDQQLQESELRYRSLSDGSSVEVESVSFPCEYDGKPAAVAWVRDISARKAAERLTYRFQTALDSSADAIYLIDCNQMRFIDMNATACSVMAYTREELLSMGPHHIKPYYNQAMLTQRFNEIIASEEKTGRIETWHMRKDDTLFPVEVNLRAIESDGRWLMVAIARDISKRKAAEQQLRDSEERFRQLAENINEVFWLRDTASEKILYASPSYEDIWERKRDALYDQPRSFLSAVHPDDRKRVWSFFNGQPGGHAPTEEEFRINRRDGGMRWVWAKIFPIADDKGKTYRYAGIAEDITARKLAEITLRESEERFRQLAENIQGVFWIRDIALDKIIYASPAYEEIWGTPLSMLYENPSAFIDAVHPEDKRKVIDAFIRQREQQVWFNEEFRLQRADGSVKWIWSRAFPVHDEHNTIYRIAGIAEDITRQKKAEFSLRQSEETARLLIEHAPVGIAMIGLDYKFSSANQALCAMLGYAAEELYALTFPDITHPDDVQSDLAMATKLFSGEIPNYSTEKRYLRKNGEVFWVHLIATIIHDQDGKPLYGMGFIEDITARREAEAQQLAALEMQRDALVREVHHRIKNNLQGVIGLMRQYAAEHTAVAGLVNDIAGKIFAVAVVHGLQSRYTTEEIELSDMLGEISQTVGTMLGKECTPHLNTESAPPARINRNEAVPVALILNELLVNACKHGHDNATLPAVSLSALQDGTILSIRITNTIMPQQQDFDFETGNGLGTGLTLVKSLLPRQGATLQFRRDGQHITAEVRLSAPVIIINPIPSLLR